MLEVSVCGVGLKGSRFFACGLLIILLLSNRFRIIEKKVFVCFLWILSSFIISAFFSTQFLRSIGSAGAGLFTYVCFFLVPLNVMLLLDREKVIKWYFLSFAVVGLHALAQFLLSFFHVYDPLVMQRAGVTTIARGQSWTYEPSYYALFAIPFVMCLNARYLLKEEGLKFWKVLGANLLLLASTSTGAFFSYFIFFLVCFFLSFFCFVKRHFPYLRVRAGKFLIGFCLFFCSAGVFFLEMFQHTFYKFFYLGLLSHWSFQERWDRIVEGWEMFCASPLFGIGLRGPEKYSYLMAHFDNLDVSLYGPINAREMYHAYTPSNVLVEVLSSLGVFGFCAIVLLAILICQLFCAALKEDRLPLQERKRIFALFISIIVMVCCLQFNQELFRNYVWAHMGISVGYVLSVNKENL